MRRLLLMLVVSALALAACGGSGRVAATVDGVDITEADIDALRPGGVTTTQRAAGDLNRLITTEVVRNGIAALGIEVTDEKLAEATEQLIADIEASGSTFSAFKESQEVTDRLVEIAVFQQVAQDSLLEHFGNGVEVTEAEIRNQFDVELHQRASVCAGHILLAFPPDADDAAKEEVADRAADLFDEVSAPGADFAALATEHSDDTASAVSGGDLGCAPPARYVAPFAAAAMAAELGVPTEPVETTYGWHIILVSDRTIPEFDDIADVVEQSLRQIRAADELSTWYTDAVNAAGVTVDPKFGTWTVDPTTGIPTVRAPVSG